MTIGIAARGAKAGGAVLNALLAAELLGRGEIAGFCTFVWRDAKGQFHYATTQRGGSSGLLELPSGWREASVAAVISSGPDRAEPLSQFLTSDPAVGLVTGHRLPTSRTQDGQPVNVAALDLMRQGRLTPEALSALLDAPGMDAGLICLPLKGPMVMANSIRVEARDDHGRAAIWGEAGGVSVLHNSIYSACLHGHAFAETVAGIAAQGIGLAPARHMMAELPDQLRVLPSTREAVLLGPDGRVSAIESADPAYGGIRPGITAIYSRMPVLQNDRLIGHAATEVFARLDTRCLYARPQVAERTFLITRL